jgi:cation diffusion facilitator family transporter
VSHNLPHRRSKVALRAAEKGQSLRTILIALAGNVAVMVAKLVAGLLTGSSAMLAEAAHSAADSVNEILLAVSLSTSRRPADSVHPFGYGRERFLWAFMAAISSFVVGGCVSIGLAVRQLTLHQIEGNQTVSWVVLAIALLADGVSWVQSYALARREARERKLSIWKYLRRSTDPILRAVIVEDSAGLIGTVLAAGGLLGSKLTGSSVPDAVASLLIGALLAFTAIALARPLADFLIGRSLPDEMLSTIHKLFLDSPAVDKVIGLQAVFTGPGEVIVAAKINAADGTLADFAVAMDDLDRKTREAVPFVADVFVDVTARTPT